MKIVFIAKGNRRKRTLLEQAVALVQDSSLFDEVAVFATEYPGHAIELARRNCSSANYLIAAGGDGTLNEVVNGCLQAARDAAMELPIIGVLASGTANDFLRSTRLPHRGGTAGTGPHRHVRDIDIGRVCYTADDGRRLQRLFRQRRRRGIGAAVVQAVNRSPAGFGPGLRYLLAILGSLITFRKPWLAVVSPEGLAWQAGRCGDCGNGACFGSGLYAVATGQDRRWHASRCVIVMWDSSTLSANLAPSRRQANHPPEVAYYAASRFDITSPGARCAIEADGEYLD